MFDENEMSFKSLAMFYIAFCRLHKDEIKFQELLSYLDRKNMMALSNFFVKNKIEMFPYKTTDERDDDEFIKIHNEDVPVY